MRRANVDLKSRFAGECDYAVSKRRDFGSANQASAGVFACQDVCESLAARRGFAVLLSHIKDVLMLLTPFLQPTCTKYSTLPCSRMPIQYRLAWPREHNGLERLGRRWLEHIGRTPTSNKLPGTESEYTFIIRNRQLQNEERTIAHFLGNSRNVPWMEGVLSRLSPACAVGDETVTFP